MKVKKPKLSNEELIVLAKNGDEDAKDELFRYNTRLCGHIAQKFKNVDDVEELIAIGNIGLIKAYNTFDVTRGFKFATYAARLIQNEILMYFRREKKHNIVTSYDMIISTDDDGSELHLLDRLAAPEDNPMRDELENLGSIMEMFKEECNADRRYGKRDLQILELLYFQKKTQRDVAEMMKVSQSYVSRLDSRIILKLRRIANKLEDDNMATKKQKQIEALKRKFLYLWENYQGIISKAEMSRILGYKSDSNLYYYIDEYKKGKMKKIIPDASIEDKIAQKFKDAYDLKINASRVEVLKTDKPAKIVDAKFDDREHFKKKEFAINKLNYTEEKKEKDKGLASTMIKLLNEDNEKYTKEYTTLEVLPLLDKYHIATFIGNDKHILYLDAGCIVENGHVLCLDYTTLNNKWKLVRKPMETLDAIHAIANEDKELLFIGKDGTEMLVDKDVTITIRMIDEGLFYEK